MKRLLKLIKQYGKVLVHKNSFFNHDFLLEDHEVFVQTTDLRFTKGRFDDVTDFDVVIYVSDSHEPLNLTGSLLEKYSSAHPLVYVGDKHGGKRLLKSFVTDTKFYDGDKIIGLIKEAKKSFNVKEHEYKCTINDTEFVFKSAQGLFSYTSLDAGTEFLLYNLPKISGSVLDFGCGVGVVGIYLASLGLDVCLTDSNYRSLHYSKVNASLNNVSVEVKPSYLAKNITKQFDFVVSNPPTHMNLEEANTLLKDLSALSRKKVFFVINNIVNYERLAKKYFSSVHVITSNNQFKILELAHQQ